MKVSISTSMPTSQTAAHSAPDLAEGEPLLDPAGPSVVLGGAEEFAGSVSPTRNSLFGPRGAHLFDDGTLVVADTGHHRALLWTARPTEDHQPADLLLGQPDFDREGRNALGDASARTMNVPTGVARFGEGGLAIADAWNNRVLIWCERPGRSGAPADIILGHEREDGQAPNRGGSDAAANTMHWPFQVLCVGERLYVADAGNRRVLVWNRLPTRTGQPADGVLGQPDFTGRSDNGGVGPGPGGYRWPHDLSVLDGNLVVTDAGNNRIFIYEGLPTEHVDARVVLGQKDFTGTEHNLGRYWPDAAAVNMPYAMDARNGRIAVADTANSRLLGFRGPFANGMEAVELTGQRDFGKKGDNRWEPATRDSLCWPYGLQLTDREAVVADTGNHRVLLWGLA
jgi:hypothetical protein